MHRFREEVLNVELASALQRRDLDANAETITRGNLPDVLIDLDGLSLVIEGRAANQRPSLFADSEARIHSGLADLSMAVLYPSGLNEAPTQMDLARNVEAGRFDGALFYPSQGGIQRIDFASADVDQLAEAIRSAFRIRIQNDIVRGQVRAVEDVIEDVVREASKTGLWFSSAALVARLTQALGLGKVATPTVALGRDLVRIAAFILFDAAIFQETLAAGATTVKSLNKAAPSDLQTFLDLEWSEILKIDYAPVFSLAREVLLSFPSSPNTEAALSRIVGIAKSVASSGVLTKHDFMGRLYHKLLLRTTGRYYATYYTSIPAAWLLANLAIKTPHENWDFSTPAAISKLRVIDPACGSGTLLSAAYMAIKDRYIRASATTPQAGELHRVLVEDVIHGWDVLDYAAHLTLTTMALHSGDTTVSRSNIYTLPVGLSSSGVPHLGSLDQLKRQSTLFGHGFAQAPTQESLEGTRAVEAIDAPSCDLVIMNPPFSRSAKPNVKFGYSEAKEKKALEDALSQLTRELGREGIGQAGLGAHFLLLALDLANESGRIAFVIPRAMLSGVSWKQVRDDISQACEVEFIVSNFDPGDTASGVDPWSWSENTNLGEILVVARKTAKPLADRHTTFVGLWNRPQNEVEALLAAHQAMRARDTLTDTIHESAWTDIGTAGRSIGCAYRVGQSELAGNWLAPCLFAAPELNALVMALQAAPWPALTLQAAATSLGKDIKQVKDAFDQSSVPTGHPIVWGHQAAMDTIELPASFVGYGKPKLGARSIALHAAGRSTLLLAERPHLSTETLVAARVTQPVLATAFWEVRLLDRSWDDAFLAWFNSTYGILDYLSWSTSSMGDIFKAKKEQLLSMRMPDPTKLDLGKISSLLGSLGSTPMKPYASEWLDAAVGTGVRRQLDDYWSRRLSLPPIPRPLYELLAADPVVCKRRINP